MNVGIAGLGWVTPLGTSLEKVWAEVRAGVVPETQSFTHPATGRALPFLAVPPGAVAHLARHPRLRRASAISQFAVAAGLAALEHAGGTIPPDRTAVVFAICDGGVLYTRRFYEQIAQQGAHAASPLLFPETVFNAPASHLAALLGLDGASYTLVGDAAVGMSALHLAAELLETGGVEQVVVVGAEETDWILCAAYAAWRLARTPLAEGAAALVLRREGRWRLQTHPGVPFFRQRDASAALARVLADFGPADRVIASANGSFIDRAEALALSETLPGIPAFSLKKSFGESPGASGLQQAVAAALTGVRAVATVIGANHQAGAAFIEPR